MVVGHPGALTNFLPIWKKNYRETERLVARTLLKTTPQRKRKSNSKAFASVSESWKKMKSIANVSPIPLGKYQKAPQHPFSVPSSTIKDVKKDTGAKTIHVNKPDAHRVKEIINVTQTAGTANIKQHSVNLVASTQQHYPWFSRWNITGLYNDYHTNCCWFNSMVQAFCRTSSFLYCMYSMQEYMGNVERYRSLLAVCQDSVTGGDDQILQSNALSIIEKDGFSSGQQH
ncbi:MAG: hypothetical protein ABW185_10685 [Sedimenticola sp.]